MDDSVLDHPVLERHERVVVQPRPKVVLRHMSDKRALRLGTYWHSTFLF
jgi:hypothetical protein